MGSKPCCCAKDKNTPTFSFKDCLKDIQCVSNCCEKKEIITIIDEHHSSKLHNKHHHHHHKHKHHLNQSNEQPN